MEIISEPCPASWEDGGLNWDSPNPTDFRYFAAIREAILERSLAVDYKLNHTLLREIRPYHVLSADQLREVGEQIYSLSQRFLCAQAEDWKPILDCYPIYQQGEYPAGIADGMPLAEGEKWLRSAKEKLDRMQYSKKSVRPWNAMLETSWTFFPTANHKNDFEDLPYE